MFGLFASEFDLRKFMLYIIDTKCQYGAKPQSWISKIINKCNCIADRATKVDVFALVFGMRQTSIMLSLELQNLMSFLDYLISTI